MSESIGPASLNAYGNIYESYSPSSSDSGLGTSYNPLNTGPPTSGGAGSTGSGTGSTVPKPPASVSDPGTGRETPDAPIEFLTWDGYHGATGTAQQILDQLPALFKYNDARAKSASLVSGGTPALRLPGGYVMQFSNGFALTQYLTRSAQPVVPTAAVAATFQSVLGRASSDQDVAQAESTFNAGKSLADYRANLVASPETVNTLQGVSRQVLGRDATPTELAADKAQLGAGKSMDDLRFDLAHGAEAAADVAGLFQSVLGRAASGPDIAGREAQLATGGSLDAVRQNLASSPEARNEVAAAFKAELGRDAPDPNITGMQQMLAAKDGSIDEVRVFLAGTKEAHDKVAAAFKGELGRDAPEANVADMQHALAARDGSLDKVRSYLAGTLEAADKLNSATLTVLGRAAQPTEIVAMQSMLVQGKSLGDIRFDLASSTEFTDYVTSAYQKTYNQSPVQVTLQMMQALADIGVPLADATSMLLNQTGVFSPGGVEAPDGAQLLPASFPAGEIPPSALTGIDAHRMLSEALKSVDSTWQTNTTFGGLFGRDRPDVLHLNTATGTLDVWELKPDTQEALGATQIQRYINSVEGTSNLAQAGDNQTVLDQIAKFRQTHPVPGLASNQLESFWFSGRTTYTFNKTPIPGVIIYTVDNKSVWKDIAEAFRKRIPGINPLPLLPPLPFSFIPVM